MTEIERLIARRRSLAPSGIISARCDVKLVVRPWWHLALGKLDMDVPHVVISITSPSPQGEREPVKIPQRWGLRDVLRLYFHDLNLDRLRNPEEVFQGRPLRLWAMQPEHAREIWAFVHRWRDQVGAIVVHCEAGVSRSPSIAMALADACGWGRDCIDWRHPCHEPPPNSYVYRVMRECQPAN